MTQARSSKMQSTLLACSEGCESPARSRFVQEEKNLQARFSGSAPAGSRRDADAHAGSEVASRTARLETKRNTFLVVTSPSTRREGAVVASEIQSK